MPISNRMRVTTDVFYSGKCARPIPHSGESIIGDLLIQLTLNTRVIEIGYVDKVRFDGSIVGVNAVTVDRIEGRYIVDVEPCRPLRSLEQETLFQGAVDSLGFRILTFTGEDIMREPRFSTARAIWSHRRIRVGHAMGIEFARALDEGPMTLHELCTIVSGPQEPVAAVMSLVCSGALEIDLDQWAGRATIVRSRS